MADKPALKLTLTPEQREQIRKQTGKEVTRLKLEPLEGRLAPGMQVSN
jgi:hypothetical protein